MRQPLAAAVAVLAGQMRCRASWRARNVVISPRIAGLEAVPEECRCKFHVAGPPGDSRPALGRVRRSTRLPGTRLAHAAGPLLGDTAHDWRPPGQPARGNQPDVHSRPSNGADTLRLWRRVLSALWSAALTGDCCNLRRGCLRRGTLGAGEGSGPHGADFRSNCAEAGFE